MKNIGVIQDTEVVTKKSELPKRPVLQPSFQDRKNKQKQNHTEAPLSQRLKPNNHIKHEKCKAPTHIITWLRRTVAYRYFCLKNHYKNSPFIVNTKRYLKNLYLEFNKHLK